MAKHNNRWGWLRGVRIALAALVLLSFLALLLDATGVVRHYAGWLPKLQLLPAALALNVVVVAALLAITWLVGRLYCSVLCPMGIFQDLFIGIRKLLFRKHKWLWHAELCWLRYVVFGLFVLLMLLGLGQIAALIAPYSAFARMVVHLGGSGLPMWIAIATLIVIGTTALLGGRLWCNAICPVGTLLGSVSRYSLFGVRIDSAKCVGCRRCEHACKSMCIKIKSDGKGQEPVPSVDGSRCVDCFNCLGKCKVGAISFGRRRMATDSDGVDNHRRQFIAGTAAVGASMWASAQQQKFDGGMAALVDRQVPTRKVPVKPAGALSLANFSSRCTACQLCVSQCFEHVLRPSTKLDRLMQPEMDYSAGYCRPACTRCSEVCPAGAIQPVSKEQKTAISVGRAVVVHWNCLSGQGEKCGACARHCPAEAITMEDFGGHLIPSVNESRCIGCGKCEYYCPARPQAAIYVEGREVHTEV
ncbi:MAG: 4Fe-4S dicluster domain-containing protein [Bacteroidales bacterium]|nr:4Fe-4S dicluster domain-containing protein [Bacteroidales bacterium]